MIIIIHLLESIMPKFTICSEHIVNLEYLVKIEAFHFYCKIRVSLFS